MNDPGLDFRQCWFARRDSNREQKTNQKTLGQKTSRGLHGFDLTEADEDWQPESAGAPVSAGEEQRKKGLDVSEHIVNAFRCSFRFLHQTVKIFNYIVIVAHLSPYLKIAQMFRNIPLPFFLKESAHSRVVATSSLCVKSLAPGVARTPHNRVYSHMNEKPPLERHYLKPELRVGEPGDDSPSN
jgi:hypothetical protein